MRELLIACGWKNADTYDLEFGDIPSKPGIYVIVGLKSLMPGTPDFGNRVIYYVGLATNLKRRLSNHPRVNEAYGLFNAVQRWHFSFDGDLRKAERAAIDFLNPTSDQKR